MDVSVMGEYWAFEDMDLDVTQVEKDRRDRLIREDLMPREVSIPIGGRVSKLLVFGANFPRSGDAHLSIPLYDLQQNTIENLELIFSF